MAPLRILVVDDDTDFARALSVFLEIEGHHVEMAFSGEEAVSKFRGQDFDMTFMDVKLPGMSGVESFFEFRKIRPDTKVMMMTAYSVEQLLNEAVDAGALGILRKPFETDALLDTLEVARPNGFILLVDDDPDFVKSTEQYLAQAGYRVISAHNGQEAVKAALANGVDALVLDQRLPILSGLEVYLELKALGRAVPTLIVTGYAKEEQQNIDKAQKMSVTGYLTKPFEPAELLRAIEQMMRNPQKKDNHAP